MIVLVIQLEKLAVGGRSGLMRPRGLGRLSPHYLALTFGMVTEGEPGHQALG